MGLRGGVHARLAAIACLVFALLAAPALAGHKANHGDGSGGGGGGTGADLAVTLADAPDPVEVGQQLTYTARVRNDGPERATGVTLTDPLPASVTFVSATGDKGTACGLSGGTVTCQIARLNAGATATISIVVRPNATGTVANGVAATADQGDPNSQNNQASTSTTVTEAAPPPPPPEGCSGHTWFLGIVYDEERRSDFVDDVDHFRRFLDTLRATHCIPSNQARILDFADGSEANLKAELRRMASEANQHADSQFFFFLSSHGLVSSGLVSECDPERALGSFAALKDGSLQDCELGDELARFAPTTRMFVAVDCSFCGGFSDSLTAASGTVPDNGVRGTPTSSGVPAPNRVVVTGCAMTTECFGSRDGGNLYRHMNNVRQAGVAACDGWTAPGFPAVQGADVPVRGATDGRCTTSEWFFAAVNRAYTDTGQVTNLGHLQDYALSIQQQFRIKYGFNSLADDLLVR